MNDTVHIFAGHFDNRESAHAYTQAQWESEPGADATDAEYAAWEERNPTCLMKDEFGVYLDSDFIETIFGEGRYEYLGQRLTQLDALANIRKLAGEESNTLVLIFSEALGGFDAEMKSTSKLQYCGQFDCRL
ncbi:MAG TPA: hypothetical protein VGB77_08510 [Abditibacteriaceae bacterium]|jgi:hypothetical protein